jgi:hypothetical protein
VKINILYYIIISYIFNILLRYILYLQIYNDSSIFYNGEIIPIWTPDASLYGFYAKQLLSGVIYPFTSEYIPAYLIYYLVKITGFSLENVLFFAPAFLSSLIVIPIILIAKIYNLENIGFLSTLFGASFVSYYYRTHLGYFDTDLLNLFFPMFSIYFLIKYTHTKYIKYILYALIWLLLFYFWYHSSLMIIISIVFTFLVYLYLFDDEIDRKYIFLGTILSIIFLYIFGFLSIDRVLDYLSKNNDILIQGLDGNRLVFNSALKYVAEAQSIGFDMFVKRVSGNFIYFIISIFGYVYLVLKYRSFLLTFPLIFISFLSIQAGLRFTIYAVPILAFSLVYGINLIFNFILVKWGEFNKKISNLAVYIFTMFIVLNSTSNLVRYNLRLEPFYFSNSSDINALKKLDRVSSQKDFIVAPWDYGWPLWYYADISTIVDNGNGYAEDKYITSKILLSDSNTFVRNSTLFFINRYKRDSNSPILQSFLKEYPISYFDKFNNIDFNISSIDRDSFILLHKDMLTQTYRAIENSSNFNLSSGERHKSNLYNIFFLKEIFSGNMLLRTDTRFKIDLEKGMIISSNFRENARAKEIVILNGDKIEFRKKYNTKNDIYILIQDRVVLVMNRKLFNSFLVQALFLNNYDRKMFREVSKSENLKILKVLP